MRTSVIVAWLIVSMLWYVFDMQLTRFEDGSFVLQGCNPTAVCAESNGGS